MSKNSIRFLKATLVIISLTIIALSVFLLPYAADQSVAMDPAYAYLKWPVLLGIYSTLIPFFIAIYQSFLLLNLIQQKAAFSRRSAIHFKTISYCAQTIIILYVAGAVMLATQSVLHPGIALLGLGIIFASAVIAIFSTVLRKLSQQAAAMKSELDLTV
ncbi:DUF2975 domain-containing protein [Jeotgalibacillus sp. R-1-5s-1]|uniref:DUF2975 domain-containing protein n=1 Tax=Jeotgalibacillus sp. R-1-5s-1 TaxID=2555897 RepID=UPI001FC8373E|nr:DUF2975 domain-containing protein [Jeotgalibacillus sp. R-1-5s-1]